jgi:hypothetical protein
MEGSGALSGRVALVAGATRGADAARVAAFR